MKLIRGKGDKVTILRNKKKGLKLLVRFSIDILASCQLNCCLWNNPICDDLKPCKKVGLCGGYYFVRDED